MPEVIARAALTDLPKARREGWEWYTAPEADCQAGHCTFTRGEVEASWAGSTSTFCWLDCFVALISIMITYSPVAARCKPVLTGISTCGPVNAEGYTPGPDIAVGIFSHVR
jgi:hypothetical protein